MTYRRGDVLIVATGGGFGGKPRPAVVVQSDLFAELSTIVVLLFSSKPGGDPALRMMFKPSPKNGLELESRLMIHAPTTVRKDDVGQLVGRVTDDEMLEIDRAMLLFLGLAG